jgi:hypothetical protein
MTDHSQQRRSPRRQQPAQGADEACYDEQHGDGPLEDEVWPPRTRTSAVRYQATTQGAPPGTALVRTTTTGQRMQGVPARRRAIPPRRTATHQRLLPAGGYEHEPLPLSRQGGCLHPHWLVYVGLGMLIMLVGWMALRTLDFVGGTLTVVFRKKVIHN